MPVLMRQLEIALLRLYEGLRTQEQAHEEELPISKLRKSAGSVVHQLCTHPQSIIYLEGPTRRMIPWTMQPSWTEGYNHPANRYIHWLLQQIGLPVPKVLGQIPAAPLSNAALPVVLNDPLYADVHRIGTKILKRQNHL